MVIGVASVGYYKYPEHPAIYTKVRCYVPFIKKILQQTNEVEYSNFSTFLNID